MGLEVVSWLIFLSMRVLVFLCTGSSFPHVAAGSVLGGNETDRLALLAFKAEVTSDPFGVLSSWNESINFCQWDGVTCGRRHQRIIVLDLNHRNLAGSISPHIGNLSFLRELRLSNNSLSQEIAPELGRLHRLQFLGLINNSISGKIPANISGCSNLIILNFNGNRLVGKIPVELGYLSKLKLLYVTKNNLTGNCIGAGSFGSVYKGILDQSGKVVAVKVLNLYFPGAAKSFIAECKALKSVKHRNLVKVFTACSSIDHLGNDFKALVYEFMVNGSLEQWLHPNENKDNADEDSRNLNFLQRFNIAIDVASAIDYLHNHCPKPIVHSDLKPSNVLLDNEMTGHVGDFGLARFLPEAAYDSSANQSSYMGIRGSIGYAAPEYGMGNEVSTFGDVYSYGILLLEMFTGKRPTDNMFCDNLSIRNFVKMALAEQVADIVDPTMFQQRENREENSSIPNTQNHSSDDSRTGTIQESMISILKVGIACSEELPRDRMAINDVVNQLNVIRNTHVGTT